MANDLPTEPHDPRWLPSRTTAVLIGLAIQLLFAVVAWSLIAGNLPKTGPLVDQVLVPEDIVFPDTEMAPKAGKQLPPIDVQQMAKPTPELLEQGATLFAEHCSSCHGAQGKGDGPAGLALQPPPRNLTSLTGWKNGQRLSDLFRTLTLGIEGTAMPAFDYLSGRERFALAHHVAGLATGRPLDTAASLDSLDAEFSLSKGSREPNVIPLGTAMGKLVAEAETPAATPDQQRLASLAATEPRGAALFARVGAPAQERRVALLLTNDSSWRTSPERLSRLALAGAPDNGFEENAAVLSRADWTALTRYLNLRFEVRQ